MNHKFISLFTICFVVFGVYSYDANAQIWMINPDGSNFAADFNDTQYPNTLHLQGSFDAGGTQYSVKGETLIDAYPSTLVLTIKNFRFSVDSTTKFTLNGFTINGVNAPGNGGVLWMPTGSTAAFNSMIFDGNIAQANGGVAAISNDSGTLNINNSTFKNTSGSTNAARGGAVYLSGGTSTLTGTNSFTGLKVSDAGGAIGVGKGTLTIGGTATFKSNSSVWGGALYADAGSGTSTVNLNANAGTITLDSNTATHGGGLYLSNAGVANLNATSGGIINFTNNKATAGGDQNAGGGITAENSNVSIKSDGAGSQVNFIGNSSPSMRGGAIYLVSNSGAYTTNITASNGGAIKFDSNSDAGWSGQYGSGAIGALGNFLNITADNGNIVFSNNKTTASGTLASGALFVDAWRNGATNSNPTLTLKTTTATSSITFTNNTIAGGASRDIAIYGGNMLVTGDAGYVYLGGGISGTGNGISLTKSGNNTLILGGDNSGYDPLFVQNGGNVKFNTASTMFSTAIANLQVSGGEQQIVLSDASAANIAKAKGTFSSAGALTYLASTANAITATLSTAANAVFSDSTDVIFGADYNMSTNVKVAANYILNADSDFSKTNLGRIIFRDSTLKLNNANYANTYGLNNTLLDLRNSSNATTTFSNLTSTNNSSVALDASFASSGGTVSLTADKLTVTTPTSGSNTIILGNVNMSNLSADNGMNLSYSVAVLSGLTFATPGATQSINSPIYRYAFGVNGNNLTMNAIGFADGNSLDAANKLTGTRKFDFAVYGTGTAQTYATSADLSNAGTGALSVLGRSGYNDVINAGGHALFNLTDATTLTIKDVTLTGASGRDITLANANASVVLGGATTINDGISGVSGSTINKTGTLNLAGDSSGFNGRFVQTGGTTTVSGKYFNGVSNIISGILNLNAGSGISSGTVLAINTGATLNLNSNDNMLLSSNQITNYAGAGGAVNKSGAGTTNITGDNSNFTGTFTQTAGTTTVASGGKMFAGTNNINGGILNVTGDSIYYKTNIGASGTWNHFATTDAANTISSSVLSLNGGTANFHDGNYVIGPALTGSGNVNVVNGTLELDSSDYTGSVAYGLNNSVMKINQNVSFTTLNTTNSSLALNVSFASGNTITTNTLTTANTGQTIGLSSVKLLNDNLYDGLNKTFTYQTLHGLTWANSAPFAIATSTWQYNASVSGTDLTLSVVSASNNMTLDTMNKMSGSRGFNFSNVGAETYAVGANLSPMAAGDFIVQGNGMSNVLDGAGYSLFDMDNATNFTLQNLSVTNANGVLVLNNAAAIANVSNTQITKNNRANGGAIYMQRGVATITNSTLSENQATTNGGAIYVGTAGNLTLINTSLLNNTANGAANDIYNDGKLIISGSGTTSVADGISGGGAITKSDVGTFQAGGDNSTFVGTFTQTGGDTTFDGKFFAGNSHINAGNLEWETGGTLSSTSVVNLGIDAILQISNNNDIALLGGQLTGVGQTYKTGTGVMTMTGDNSIFTGTYLQTAGTTVVAAADKFFDGENIIENSSLNIAGTDVYYHVSIGGGGRLTHTGGGTIGNNLKFTGTDGGMLFTGTNALYTLTGKIENGNPNNIGFQNANVLLGAADFTGGTAYSFDNSTLDLRNNALDTVSFTNLNFSNGSKISLNLDLDTMTADTLTTSNYHETIDLGQIALLAPDDDGSHIGYTFDVLNGLTFSGVSDTVSLTTSAYNYRVETSGTQIILTAIGADSNTLYRQNALSGNRSFDFHIYNNSGEYTPDDVVSYHNTSALGTTSAGVFNVIGRASDATKSVIDGALADGTYGTLFNLANNTTLNISDLTLQNVVTPSANGPMLSTSNAVAIANLSNVIVSNNSGNNGGAIYNKSATINITSGTFENNIASTNGGAIYNAGALNLNADAGKSITFANNTANGVTNDIYNSTTLNIGGAGTVNIGGGISGTGMLAMKNGVLNMAGDSSSYTGTFRQTNGTTNVGGAFFAGKSDIYGGTINFNNGATLSTGNTDIHSGAIANITADNFAINGQFSGDGAINKTGAGTMNVTGDNSRFTGTFTQTGGTTIANGTLFDTTMNIDGGTMQLNDNVELSFDTKFNIANGATLDIANTTAWDIDLNSSNLTASGNVNKTGNGVLYMSGDFSSDTGKFTQTDGITVLADDTKLFGNTASQNVISGGILQVNIDHSDEFNHPVTLDGGTLHYLSNSADPLTIDNAALSEIVVSNPNTQIVFDTASSTTSAKYNLAENINAGGAGITFDNSYITLGSNDFTGATTYTLNNSTLDLSSEIVANTTAPIQNIVFDNLVTNNSWLDLDVNFALDTTQPDTLPTIVTSDMVTNNGAAQQINLGVIKFHNGNADDGKTDIYTIKVLDGNITFQNAQDIHYASGAYMYEVKTEIGGQTINLDGMGPAGAHSLYTMNAQSGERIFSLDEYPDANYVYHIDGSLSQTAVGNLTLIGNSAGTQVVSGAIVDGTGGLTGAHGSLFAINSDAAATLSVQNITISDAAGANGALLSQDNIDAISYFQNATIKNNTATTNGGAIYNNTGSVNIIDQGNLSNNTAGTNGGAIYNNAILNLAASSGHTITFANNVANGVANDIYNSGTVNITGAGAVNINSGVSGASGGIINMAADGTFNVNADSSSYVGEFVQTNGTTNVTSNFFAGTNTIHGGELNFTGTGAQTGGMLNIAGGLVNVHDTASISNTTVALDSGRLVLTDNSTTSNSTVNISNGALFVDTNATVNNGTIALNGGHVAVSGKLGADTTTITDGVLEMQTGGTLSGGTLTMNGGGLAWSGTKQSSAALVTNSGTLVVSNATLDLNNAGDKIAAATQFHIEANSTLHNTAGNVTIGRDDLISGTLRNDATASFSGGAYDYTNAAGGTFVQTNASAVTNIIGGAQMMLGAKSTLTAGTVNIGGDGVSNSLLGVGANATFAKEIKLNVNADNHFVVHGGTATVDSADTLNGTIDLLAGDLYFDNATLNGALAAGNGALHIQNGTLDVGTNSTIAKEVNIMLAYAAKMNVNTGSDISISNEDLILGKIGLNGGKMTFDGLTNTNDFEIDVTGGTLALINGTNWTAHTNDSSTAATNIEITDSTMNILAGSGFNTFANVSIKNGTINMMNSATETYNFETVTLVDGGNANFAMDIDGANLAHDIFTIGSLSGVGTINISNVRLLSAPKDLTMNMNVFRIGSGQLRMGIMADETVSYTTSVDTVHTAIYDYSFVSNNDGTYTLSRQATAELASFNPTVFRGQAAATALLSHEMSITNMIFDHVYLDSRGCMSCHVPGNYADKRNGIWVKPFYVTETFAGTNTGNNIDSDFYGTIAGFDFQPIRVSYGWRFMPTVYGTYTGSKTNDITQNGFRFGAMGTLTDGRFGATLMLYGGTHSSQMDLDGITDSASMTFGGGAVKTAYDFNVGKFIIQPNLIAGYKVIGNQNWNTDFGNITMETDTFDGFNAAPGLSLIYKQNGWSAYALSRYMVQLSGCTVKSRADGVELPTADACRDYAEFGVGAAMNLSNTMSGFIQTTTTAGGRTGIGGKMGLNYKF